jgi:hypothetical protein
MGRKEEHMMFTRRRNRGETQNDGRSGNAKIQRIVDFLQLLDWRNLIVVLFEK